MNKLLRIVRLKTKKTKKKLAKSIEITEGKLFEQTAIHLWACAASSVFILMVTSISINYFSPTEDFHEYYTEWQGVFIFLMAILSFWLSLVVNAHRTVQTNHQISSSKLKNKSDFYLSHYKYNIDILSSLEFDGRPRGFNGSIRIFVKSPSFAYRKFYPKNNLRDGVLELNSTIARLETISAMNSLYLFHVNHDNKNLDIFSSDKPTIEYNTGELVKMKTRIRLLNICQRLELLLSSYGIKLNVEYDDDSIEHDFIDEIKKDDIWIYMFINMFSFWCEVNRCLHSDMDEESITKTQNDFWDFLGKVGHEIYS